MSLFSFISEPQVEKYGAIRIRSSELTQNYWRDNMVQNIASTLMAVCGAVTDPFYSTSVATERAKFLRREEVAHSFVLPLSLTTIVVEKENKGLISHNDYEGNESELIPLTGSFGPSLDQIERIDWSNNALDGIRRVLLESNNENYRIRSGTNPSRF